MAGTSRRRFVTGVTKTACGVSLVGLGLGLYTQKSSALPAASLRPPGALPEEDFLGACVRCGLCVRDCPFDTLKLARMNDAAPLGTPFFTARDVPCEMCDDIPCVAACPTGALDPALEDIDEADMGVAVLIDQETCLNFLGLRCDVCYRVCPAIDKAITLELQHNQRSGGHAMFLPTVHSEACTGCGKCEHSCVLDEAAIKVLPAALAKGKASAHYQLGWEEKAQAGESLIGAEPEHRYNMPEDMEYDFDRGLSPAKPEADPP
jgi:ferredoxin-type protein NapG